MIDCFGRSLHAKYKDDGSGIGSFQGTCSTLKVSDFNLPKLGLSQSQLSKMLYDMFEPWGEIVDIHLNAGKCLGYVKYRNKLNAQFA